MATDIRPASPSVSSDASDDVSDISRDTAKSLEEGDLVTGFIEITNLRTYMLPPVKNWDRANGKNDAVRSHLHLHYAGQLTRIVRFL